MPRQEEARHNQRPCNLLRHRRLQVFAQLALPFLNGGVQIPALGVNFLGRQQALVPYNNGYIANSWSLASLLLPQSI